MYFTRMQSLDRETECTRYELDHGLVCHMAHTRDIPGAAMSAQAQQLSHPLLRAPQPDMGVAESQYIGISEIICKLIDIEKVIF